MDYRLEKESFTVSRKIFDGSVTQQVELDYILPDYYPEIFNILSVRLIPSIERRSLGASRLDFELGVLVKMVYLSESGEVSAVEQSLSYGKSQEMPGTFKSPVISISAVPESVGCKVVNKRRVDIKGVVSAYILVLADEEKEAVSRAVGGGIQLKRTLVTFPSKRISVNKRISVSEEIDLGSACQGIKTVLRTNSAITSLEKRILSGKLLIKGEAEVALLYLSSEKEEPQSVKFSLTFTQISDVEGLDEHYDVSLSGAITRTNITQTGKSDPSIIGCELAIEIDMLAMRFESAELAVDAYSTLCESSVELTTERLESAPIAVNESKREKTTLTYRDGEISSVIFAGAEVGRIKEYGEKNGSTVLRGLITFYAYAKNEDGRLIYLETKEQLELSLSASESESCQRAQVRGAVLGSSYKLTASNALEITVDIRLTGFIYEDCEKSFVINVLPDDTKPLESDSKTAIKLYFAKKGEEPWDIAKSCRASLEAISEENELDSERLEEDRMILIPLVGQ